MIEKLIDCFLGVHSKEAAKLSLLYSYKHGFSGFAALLTKSQAELMIGFHLLVVLFICSSSFLSKPTDI